MAFKDKELQKLSQDIINRAMQGQSGIPGTASPADRLRAAIRKQGRPPQTREKRWL